MRMSVAYTVDEPNPDAGKKCTGIGARPIAAKSPTNPPALYPGPSIEGAVGLISACLSHGRKSSAAVVQHDSLRFWSAETVELGEYRGWKTAVHRAGLSAVETRVQDSAGLELAWLVDSTVLPTGGQVLITWDACTPE
jgi:hypothetical protein